MSTGRGARQYSTRRPLPVEEVDVWLVDHAGFLHPLTQVCGRGKRLRAIEILHFKKNDNLVGVIRITKQVLLCEPCLVANWLMGVVHGLPRVEVPDFAPD